MRTLGSAVVVGPKKLYRPLPENARRSMSKKTVKLSKQAISRVYSDRLVSFGSGISFRDNPCNSNPFRCLWCWEIRERDPLFPDRLLVHCQNCGQIATTQREEKDVSHIYVEEYEEHTSDKPSRVIRIPRQRTKNAEEGSRNLATA